MSDGAIEPIVASQFMCNGALEPNGVANGLGAKTSETARCVGIKNGVSVYMHLYIYMSQHIGSGHHLELEFREAIGQQRKAWTWQSGCWPRGHIGAVEPSGEPEHNELASLQRRGRDSPDLDPIIGT